MNEQEYRMICAHYGEDGHQLHAYLRRTEKTAIQGVIDANHSAEQTPDGFYNQKCTPYIPQVRPVVDWENLT